MPVRIVGQRSNRHDRISSTAGRRVEWRRSRRGGNCGRVGLCFRSCSRRLLGRVRRCGEDRHRPEERRDENVRQECGVGRHHYDDLWSGSHVSRASTDRLPCLALFARILLNIPSWRGTWYRRHSRPDEHCSSCPDVRGVVGNLLHCFYAVETPSASLRCPAAVTWPECCSLLSHARSARSVSGAVRVSHSRSFPTE
jgi:hypothetical protein